jgi:hypothetical protein
MTPKEIKELQEEIVDAKIVMIQDEEALVTATRHFIDSTKYYYELSTKLDYER